MATLTPDHDRLIHLILENPDDADATAALERAAARYSDPLLGLFAGAAKGFVWREVVEQCERVEPHRWTPPLLEGLRGLLNRFPTERPAPARWIERLCIQTDAPPPPLALVNSVTLGPDIAQWSREVCARFFQSPALAELERLCIQTDAGDRVFVEALVSCPWLQNLIHLVWNRTPDAAPSPLDDVAASKLLTRPWTRLRLLSLRGHRLGEHAALALDSIHVRGLERLDLQHNPLSTDALKTLLTSPHLTALPDMQLPQGQAFATALDAAQLQWSALRKHIPQLRPQDAAGTLDARLLQNLPVLLDDFVVDRDRHSASAAIQRLAPWWVGPLTALRMDPKTRASIAQKLPAALAACQTDAEYNALTGLAIHLPLNTPDRTELWTALLTVLATQTPYSPYGWPAATLVQELVRLPLVGDWVFKRRNALRLLARFPSSAAGRTAIAALKAANHWDAASAEAILLTAIQEGASCGPIPHCLDAFQLDPPATHRLAVAALRLQKNPEHVQWAQQWSLERGDVDLLHLTLCAALNAALRGSNLHLAVSLCIDLHQRAITHPESTPVLVGSEDIAACPALAPLVGAPLYRAVWAVLSASLAALDARDALNNLSILDARYLSPDIPPDACTLHVLSHWGRASNRRPHIAAQHLSAICDQHSPDLLRPFLRALAAATSDKTLRRTATKRLALLAS